MKILYPYLLTITLIFTTAEYTLAQTPIISFDYAQSFAVLAATTVTNTGPSIVSCNVGVSPGSSVTGFDLPVTVDGTITNGQVYREVASIAGAAQTNAHFLYNQLLTRVNASAVDLTDKGLGYADGVMSLNPGLYTFSSSALLKDTLVLNDGGDPNAIFIIKIASTLTTASYSKVKMKSGGKGANVFWLIGSSATIGTYTQFCGNIIAVSSITMTTGCTTTGKLISLGAAVTMDTNKVLSDYCLGAPSFSVLPITYLSFTAVCSNQHALLAWSTASEINNSSFTIEKSDNGSQWVSTKIINGKGNSSTVQSYTFNDASAVNSITYYRLKQTNLNGTISYSTTVIFKKCSAVETSKVTIYPNPSSGKFNLLFAGDKNNIKLIEVYNLKGEKVYETVGSQSKFDLSNKPTGIYYVRLHSNLITTVNIIFLNKD